MVLSDAGPLLRFLFVGEDAFSIEEPARAKVLTEDARAPLEAAINALETVEQWDPAVIEDALRTALVEGLGLKPRKAFAPVRVALTGSTVSPPLYESIELLGRERTLARLRAALPA